MLAGSLRHRVRIERHAEVVGAGGERTKTWNDSGTVWASVEPLSAKELQNAAQTKHAITHRVTIRNRLPDHIGSAKARIVFGVRVFQVVGATSKNERGIVTELLCEEMAGVTP